MTMRNHGILALAIAAVAVTVGAMVGQGAELEAEFSREVKALSADVTALKKVWADSLGKLAGQKTPGGSGKARVATFVLAKALAAQDVKLELIHDGERWIGGQAWVPALKSALSLRGISGISLAAGPGETVIEGRLAVEIPKDALVSHDRGTRAELRIRVAGSAGGMAGTYETASGPTAKKGRASGRLRPLGAAYALPSDYPVRKFGGKDGFELYALGIELERDASRVYRDILLLDACSRGHGDAGAPELWVPPRPVFSASSEGRRKTKRTGKGGKTRKAAKPVIDLDDVDDLDLGLGDGGAGTVDTPAKGKRFADHPAARDRLKTLRDIRQHVARMRRASEAAANGGAKGPAVASSFPDLPDKQFGPWFGFAPLPGDKKTPNRLPPYTGSAGTQEWLHLDGWRVLGPMHCGAPATACATLPHIFVLPSVSYPAVRDFIPPQDEKAKKTGPVVDPETAVTRWEPYPVDVGTGILRPPQWHYLKMSGYGSCICGTTREDSMWFAATEVHSDKDREVWVAAGADADAMLWLNDRLVAAWPDPEKRCDMESPIMFRAAFQKGRNTILARVRHTLKHGQAKGYRISGLWVRVCTRGVPADAATAAERDRLVAERLKDLRPAGPEVLGWRGNWRGVHPEAQPVTAWDYRKRINVRWQAPLTTPQQMSGPVVVGEKVVVLVDPCHIACFDKHTGKHLWLRDYSVLEFIDKALYEKTKPQFQAYWDGWQEAFKDFWWWQEEDDAAAAKRGEAGKALRTKYREYWKPVSAAVKKAGHVIGYLWSGYMGLSCATPVTDGEHIWVWTAMGTAACFDSDGNRKWMVRVKNTGSSYGAYSSPLLIDGKLILEFVPEDTLVGGKGSSEFRNVWFLALDAKTGKELWRTPVLEPIGSASPIATRLTNGNEDMTVLITGGTGCAPMMPDGRARGTVLGGTVVRADDGKVLIPNMSVNAGYGTPVAAGDRVYHCGPNMMSGARLIMRDRDTVGAQRLWTRYFRWSFEPCVSPYGDHLYATLGSAGPGGQGHAGYAIFDAATGRQVVRHVNVDWPVLAERGGRAYVPTSVAGGFVFVGCSGRGFGGKELPQANMTVFEAGPQGRMLAQNGLPPRCDSALAFDGDRIYYRATRDLNALVCLGHTGDEGKAYEADVNARMIMDDLPAEAPTVVKAVAVPAWPGRVPSGVQRGALFQGCPASGLYSLGLRTDKDRDMLLAGARGEKSPRLEIAAGGRVTRFVTGGQTYGMQLAGKGRARRGRLQVVHARDCAREWKWEAGTRGHGLFCQVFRNERARTVRFMSRTRNPAVHAWLGGVPVKHQQRYRLAEGYYVLLAAIEVCDSLDAEDLCLDFSFVPSADDPADDMRAYTDELRGAATYLERVVKLKPESDTAKRAKEFLAKVR